MLCCSLGGQRTGPGWAGRAAAPSSPCSLKQALSPPDWGGAAGPGLESRFPEAARTREVCGRRRAGRREQAADVPLPSASSLSRSPCCWGASSPSSTHSVSPKPCLRGPGVRALRAETVPQSYVQGTSHLMIESMNELIPGCWQATLFRKPCAHDALGALLFHCRSFSLPETRALSSPAPGRHLSAQVSLTLGALPPQ